MKKIFSMAAIMTFALFSFECHQKSSRDTNGAATDANQQETISISGAFALYPITVKWADEFKKLHPNVRIDISAGGAGKGVTDVLSGLTNIGLLSRELTPEEIANGGYAIAVTKDAVVPVISAANPNLKEIELKGIKKDALNDIFITGKITSWGPLGVAVDAPLHTYTRSDAAGAAETWAKYFNKKQEDLKGVGVYGDPGLAQAVKKDPAGIGFNNIVYVYDSKTKQATNGVVPLPIDLNNNGKIDPDENFYGSIDQLDAAIAAGKYPSPPARNLFFLTKGPSTNGIVNEFIKFVLTDGQQYVKDAGYVSLSAVTINASLSMLK